MWSQEPLKELLREPLKKPLKENLGYDKHLFFLELDNMDLSTSSVFYRSVLTAWSSVFTVHRDGFSHSRVDRLF